MMYVNANRTKLDKWYSEKKKKMKKIINWKWWKQYNHDGYETSTQISLHGPLRLTQTE